jgi:hypothetical protein
LDWGLRYKRVASNAASLSEVAGDAAIPVDPSDVALTSGL